MNELEDDMWIRRVFHIEQEPLQVIYLDEDNDTYELPELIDSEDDLPEPNEVNTLPSTTIATDEGNNSDNRNASEQVYCN